MDPSLCTDQLMPRGAVHAAMLAFAQVLRERHPGIVALPLGEDGADGDVGAGAAREAGEVVRPFAAVEGRDALLYG
jgi:hypothetical protein